MPILPTNSLCAELNCKELRNGASSFCQAHGGKQTKAPRLTDKHYQSPAWRSIRRRQLSTQPLCQACLTRGHICAAAHVDHLFPWNVIGGESFLRNIFQSLCQPCHSHKTGQEHKGIIEHYVADKVVVYAVEDYSFVLANGVEIC